MGRSSRSSTCGLSAGRIVEPLRLALKKSEPVGGRGGRESLPASFVDVFTGSQDPRRAIIIAIAIINNSYYYSNSYYSQQLLLLQQLLFTVAVTGAGGARLATPPFPRGRPASRRPLSVIRAALLV